MQGSGTMRDDPLGDHRLGNHDAHRHDEARILMVASQLRPSGVNDPRVISVMARVPREMFVPADRAAVAYSDRPVPLGGGREMNAPIITGRLLNELKLQAWDRALLIGAGGGYAAALLSELVKHVVAVEEDIALAGRARTVLAGTANVTLVEARLAAGHAEGGSYDVILIDGAVERIPNTISAQLAEGGRLAAGLIDGGVGRLVIGRRAGAGFGAFAFEDGEAVRLPGFARAAAFTF